METAYEAIYIIETNLPDEQANGIVDKYSGVVTRGGGTIDDIDRWEPRRLAYEVKGRREGVYVVMNFRSEPAAKDELDRIFRISDDVLRHMVIKQDENADRFPSKVRAAEYERRERELAARAVAPAAPPVAEPVTEIGVSGVPLVEHTTSPAEEAPVVGIPNEAAAPPPPGEATTDAVATNAAPSEEETEATGTNAV